MSVIRVSNNIINPPAWRVYVNGALRSDIVCQSINRTVGKRPVTATFTIPWRTFYDQKSELEDAEIVVYARHIGNVYKSKPDFLGYVLIDEKNLSATQSGIRFQARSITGILNKVHVGQRQQLGEVLYRKKDQWTVGGILEDLFSAERFVSQWRQKVRLGSTRALSKELLTSDVSFPATSYRDAIYRLADLAGNFQIVETFDRTNTTINFEEFGDTRKPATRIQTPTSSRGPSQGAFATQIKETTDHNAIYSRCIGYGRPKRLMISLATEGYAGLANNPLPLVPAWPNASAYPAGTETADEQAVLDNPQIATPSNKQLYADTPDDQRLCFRLFRFPVELDHLAIYRKNVLELTNISNPSVSSSSLPIQVIVEYYNEDLFVSPGVAGVDIRTDTTTQRRLIKGARIDSEKKLILLPQPAVRLYEQRVDAEGGLQRVFHRAPVIITITVGDREARVFYDTGNVGVSKFPTIGANPGTVATFINESLGLDQVCARSNDIVDSQYQNQEFDCMYYDESSDTFTTVTAATVVDNDLEQLKEITERYLSERSIRRTTKSVRLPALAEIALMDRVEINGMNLQVVSVQHVIGDASRGASTTITATNAIPATFRAEAAQDKTPTAGRQSNQSSSQSPSFREQLQQANPALGDINQFPDLPYLNQNKSAVDSISSFPDLQPDAPEQSNAIRNDTKEAQRQKIAESMVPDGPVELDWGG